MLSGNRYMSRSSLGSTIYQCLQQIPKEVLLAALFISISNRYQKKTFCFSRLGKKVIKMYFIKGGIL